MFDHCHQRHEYIVFQSIENDEIVWQTQPDSEIRFQAKGDLEALYRAAMEAFKLTGNDRVYVIEPSELGGRGVVDIFGKDIVQQHAKELARIAAAKAADDARYAAI